VKILPFLTVALRRNLRRSVVCGSQLVPCNIKVFELALFTNPFSDGLNLSGPAATML
jgi:hypothetical protein